MTTREFNPRTADFNATIRVERTERATILAVPRSLDDFTRERKPSLLGRLADMFSAA
ncbi:hypothetical protein [Corynebacterium marinum]|jgi:hypothetical protein|uniref:Uncharacterized protein n=2 Tax=Corynebacterium marinum TaxID=349751 RepID=A0A0B6TWM6_9CORY|nr:hypothetical protein [Corynebacterium marinum]AJK69980.1 hypothetical protein B840_12060 [Corynebacterium marinum DSM 44953]NLF91273.1 hypothetical protein [Corynebacterium marinum]GGO13493.1 hypothetical protein GCM10010980_06940 [Corynebacterium marinum]